mmetsp:Transcript_21835/g.35157  ORF Transcript_21835/g.35157 Transcript_21835/m.35157 type:complete len:210 (+) Transcript_21835:466-1095(+)
MTFFPTAVSSSLNTGFKPAEIPEASTSSRRGPSNGAASDSAALVRDRTREASSAPFLSAEAAAPLVTATILRTPLAIAVSSVITKLSASAVFITCVPPHNSTLYPPHFSSLGADCISNTLAPTLTTRTGSGYASPNTARRLLMACASFSGITLVSTGMAFSITALTVSSTSFISDAVRAFLYEKSNLSFSSSTSDPLWSISGPRTFLSA